MYNKQLSSQVAALHNSTSAKYVKMSLNVKLVPFFYVSSFKVCSQAKIYIYFALFSINNIESCVVFYCTVVYKII
jgi:hypothetical protein